MSNAASAAPLPVLSKVLARGPGTGPDVLLVLVRELAELLAAACDPAEPLGYPKAFDQAIGRIKAASSVALYLDKGGAYAELVNQWTVIRQGEWRVIPPGQREAYKAAGLLDPRPAVAIEPEPVAEVDPARAPAVFAALLKDRKRPGFRVDSDAPPAVLRELVGHRAGRADALTLAHEASRTASGPAGIVDPVAAGLAIERAAAAELFPEVFGVKTTPPLVSIDAAKRQRDAKVSELLASFKPAKAKGEDWTDEDRAELVRQYLDLRDVGLSEKAAHIELGALWGYEWGSIGPFLSRGGLSKAKAARRRQQSRAA